MKPPLPPPPRASVRGPTYGAAAAARPVTTRHQKGAPGPRLVPRQSRGKKSRNQEQAGVKTCDDDDNDGGDGGWIGTGRRLGQGKVSILHCEGDVGCQGFEELLDPSVWISGLLKLRRTCPGGAFELLHRDCGLFA